MMCLIGKMFQIHHMVGYYNSVWGHDTNVGCVNYAGTLELPKTKQGLDWNQ